MTHRFIILKMCILAMSIFFFADAARADYFQVVTQHANTETAGDSFSVMLVAKDATGGTITNYAGNPYITWSSDAKNSPNGFSPLMPSGIQSFEGGVVIAQGFILPCAGTCTLFASNGELIGTSTTITVNPNAATEFKIAIPSSAMAGSAFSISSLVACDWCGNTATDYHGQKSLSYSGPGTTCGNPRYPNPVSFDHGIATLPLKIMLFKAEEDIHIHVEEAAVSGYSGTITVSAGTPAYFEVTTVNNNIEQSGIPFSIQIRARDLYGNLATGYDGDFPINCTWTATSSPSGAKPVSVQGTDATTFTNGVANISNFILTNSHEMPTISVTDGRISGTSKNITVNPGTVTRFKVATTHDNIETANTTFKVSLTCQDTYENILTNFNGSYSISWQWTASKSPNGYSPSKPGNGIQWFTNGIATIDGFTLTKAGEKPIITASSVGISGTSSSITVNPGEAASFQVNAPATVNAGQSFLLSPIVAYDYCGNIATSYQGQKTLSYSGPVCGPVSGTPSFTTIVYFSNGSSTTELKTTLVCAGTSSISIDDGTISGRSGTITVMAGNAAIFSLITQNNGTETAGSPFEMSIVASDIFGNFASGYEGNQYLTWTWNATNSPLPGNTQPRMPTDGNQFFTNGSATVTGITLFNAQEKPVISVSDGNIRGTSSQITVMPTGVTHFEMTTQHNQVETAGSTFSVTLTARDLYSNVATNYVGNRFLVWGLNATSSPTNIMPGKPDDGLQIFNQGRVEVNGFRLTRAEDTATITVTEQTVCGTCGQIMVKSGTLTTFSLKVPASVYVNKQFEIEEIIAMDDCGNTAKNYYGNKTLTYTGPNNSPSNVPPIYTNPVNFAGGKAAKLFTTLVKVENTTIRVRDGVVYGESALIDVKPSLTSRFEIITKNNDTETAGDAFSVSIRVLDVYNNLDKSYTGSHRLKWQWNATRSPNDSLPSIAQEGDCIFFNGVAEMGGFRLVNAEEMPIIIAKDSSIEGSSKPIIVQSAKPTSFEVITPGYVNAGEPFNITKITAKDNFGNIAKRYTGDKSLTYSGPGTGFLKGSPSYVNVVNFDKGISTTILKTTLYKAERVRIHVEEGGGIFGSGIFGDSLEVVVRGAGAAVFQVVSQNDNEEIAGEMFSLTIRTRDEFGNEVSGYEHQHYLEWFWNNAVASPNGVMPDRPLSGNADFEYGVVTVPGFRLTNATCSPTISVTDGSVRGTSSPIKVKPSKAVSFDIAVPSPVTVNRPFNISNVAAKDAFGNIALSYAGDKILGYTGPKSDAVNGEPSYTYAAHFEKGILTNPLNTILSKEETTAIRISEGSVVGTSNGIEVLTMGACFKISPHEVYAGRQSQIMNCWITNNNSAEMDKIQIIIPNGFTFVYLSVPQCSDKNKVWNAKASLGEITLIPATVSDCLLSGESIQIEITVKVKDGEQDSVAWPCMITSGSFTLRASELKKGDSWVRITAYRLEADAFPKVILLGGTATIIATLAEIVNSKPYFNGLVEFSVVSGTENAQLLGDPKVYTNLSGSASITLLSGTSTGTVTVQIKYREYDIKTVNIRIVSNVPKIIPGKHGFIKQNEVIVKPITPVSLVSNDGFGIKYRIDEDGTWTTYTNPFSVDTYGVHTIYYACVDENGNPGPIISSPLFVIPDICGELINYPNPFSPYADKYTRIEYHLDSPMDVEIRIYNLFGELVRDMDKPSDKDGIQYVDWDGRNGSGDVVGNGGYICVVKVKGQEKEMRRKILVVK